MACGNDSCTDRLNREWTLLQRRPAPPGWPDETATLADVLAGIAIDPDRCLGQLLTWHAAGDELAGLSHFAGSRRLPIVHDRDGPTP